MERAGFRVVPHTADVRLELWGATLEELYAVAAVALCSAMGKPQSLLPAPAFQVRAAGVDEEDLLVRVLSELLGKFEIEGAYVTRATCTHLARGPEVGGERELELTLRCEGGRIDRDEEPDLQEIKAVTYHGLDVVHGERQVEATIVLDL